MQREARMPTNLPTKYFEIEKKLKTASSTKEKIFIMEELLSIIPKHKGTEKLQALYKTKIAKLKFQMQKKPITASHSSSFYIEKAGAGQVIIIGPPNSGKSTLIKSLTNANPEIGDYPFTTRIPSPAMMPFENIQVQLIDTPPITPIYMKAWHHELIKESDATLIVLDLTSTNPVKDFHLLLEKLKEKNIDLFPDSQEISSNKQLLCKKALIVLNKNDISSVEEKFISFKKTLLPGFIPVSISASHEYGLENLKKRIFCLLNILRVYSKTPGKEVDLNNPFIFKKGSTVMDMAKSVHKDFFHKLKFARIWGKNKFQGQKVNRNYILQDEDLIELHI